MKRTGIAVGTLLGLSLCTAPGAEAVAQIAVYGPAPNYQQMAPAYGQTPIDSRSSGAQGRRVGRQMGAQGRNVGRQMGAQGRSVGRPINTLTPSVGRTIRNQLPAMAPPQVNPAVGLAPQQMRRWGDRSRRSTGVNGTRWNNIQPRDYWNQQTPAFQPNAGGWGQAAADDTWQQGSTDGAVVQP